MKAAVLSAVVTAAVALFSIPLTYAATPPALMLTDNAGDSAVIDSSGTVTCTGICSTDPGFPITSTPGIVEWHGIVGPFSVNIVAGESKPFLTPPQIQLGFQITTGNTGGTLTARWSDTGFDGVGPVTMEAASTLSGSVAATYTGYADNTNALFGTGTTVGTFSQSGTGGATNITGAGPTAEPYSMTGSVVAVMGTNSLFSLAALNLMGTPPPPLVLNCAAATTGQVGVPYSSALAASGGVPPYTYSIASGTLPNGLTLNSTTGAITGTPTESGIFSFTAQVTDSNVNTALNTVQTTCMITISAPPALTLLCPTSTGQEGQPYASKLMASGGVPPYTFSITAGSLPPGLTLDTVLGTITGVPTQAGTFNFTAEVQDSTGTVAGTVTANCSIVIAPPPVTLTCASSTGQVGVAYSSALVASGGVPPYTFSITSGSLPSGLTLNTSTGAITGTPTTAGTFNFTAKVMDSTGTAAGTITSSCSIVIAPAPVVLTCASGTGQVGVAYSSALVASGGVPPYTFSITTGSLPPGLTLNTTTGAITGTPTTAGTFNFTAMVVDSTHTAAGTTTSGCSIVIAPSPVTLTCASSTGQVGVAYSSALVASGGVPPYTFSIASGSLPPGLTLNTTTGAITGTPTTAGTYNFTAKVTDSSGDSATGTFSTSCSIVIAPPPVTVTCASSTGQVGVAYSSALVASGGVPPYTFSIASGSLPPGLTLNPSTGAITGTPTTAGTFNFTAKVVDSRNSAAGTTTTNCSIVIAPVVTGPPLSSGDTATIGFWHNKNGQAIILSLNGSSSSTALGNWLATNFPNLFGPSSGNNLTGLTNTQVAAQYLTVFGNNGGVVNNTKIQIFATALAVYATNSTLAGSNDTLQLKYGFNVSATGTGVKTFNVGSDGTAVGLMNNTSYTVTQLLQTVNALSPISPSATAVWSALNDIFNGINQGGDIS